MKVPHEKVKMKEQAQGGGREGLGREEGENHRGDTK